MFMPVCAVEIWNSLGLWNNAEGNVVLLKSIVHVGNMESRIE